jgi:hypothetical protein
MLNQEVLSKTAEIALANLLKQLQETKNNVYHIEGAIEGIKLFVTELKKVEAGEPDAGQTGC